MNANLGQGLLIVLAFIVCGLLCCFSGVNSWRIYSSSSNWTKTPAEIEELKLMEATKKGRVTGYSIKISYRYQFDNKKYSGSRLSSDDTNYSTRGEAMEVYQPFKTAVEKKMPVEVLVNPRLPGESVVTRSFSARIPVMVIGGLLLALTGVWLGFSIYKKYSEG